ncbi:MAG: hypothetical protein Q8R40_03905 [bacterium]|nr:hypothetical protein [bacterium]
MDETTSPKRKPDGIRRKMDSVVPKRALRADAGRKTLHANEQRSAQHDSNAPALLQEESKEQPQFKPTAAQKARMRDDPVIKDAIFKKEVSPPHFLLFRNKNILALMCGMGVTVVAAGLLSTVFAQVTVTVKPTIESIQLGNTLVAFDASVSEVDINKRIIPAEFLTFNGNASQEFEATGHDYVEEKARGRVRIINMFSTSPQALVVNTRFITDAGVLYRLGSGITIPGAKSANGKLTAQFVEAELMSDKPGEESNISGEIKLYIPGFKGSPKYEGFYAIAQNGFSGGSKGESRVVTRADLTSAQEQVTKKVFDDLRASMARKIPANFTFVESLSQIEISNITAPKEKSKADRFQVEARGVGRVFVFRNDDIFKLLSSIILKEDVGTELMQKSADVRYRIKEANYEKKSASVEVSGTIKTKKVISLAELTNMIRSKKEGSLIEVLKQRREIATFKVSFFPPWIFSAPDNTRNIHIIVEDPSAEAKPRK